MRLPTLPYMPKQYIKVGHHKTDSLQFLGLNLTDNTRDGEFQDMLGLSSRRFPFLSQIRKRTPQYEWGEMIRVLDVFIWDGDTFVVTSEKLYRNKDEICDVEATYEKQMAVINTKLVIFPDKIYVDLDTNEVHSLVKKDLEYDSYTFTSQSITASGLGSQLASGDTVELSGGLTGHRLVVSEIEDDTVTFLEAGITGDGTEAITIKSSVPDLDFICSHNNRIWGVCREDNTIYASALGDPTTFFEYGNDAGAYAVAVGSEGRFTGICSYGGNVLAWKENMLHKMMGSNPSEYYMVDTPIYGVQEGSERSLVTINNVLYYKGTFGVYRYSGSSPVLISQALGSDIYMTGVAGTDGERYYICLSGPKGAVYPDFKSHLYSYDLQYGIWMREADTRGGIKAFANNGNDVYYVEFFNLYLIENKADPELEWFGEFAPFTEGTFSRKGYTRLVVRMDMEPGSSIVVKIKQDEGEFKRVWERKATTRVTSLVPVRLGRCDRLTLRIEGKGEVLIRGIEREFVTGSEVN